jgi:hypothetical protein
MENFAQNERAKENGGEVRAEPEATPHKASNFISYKEENE